MIEKKVHRWRWRLMAVWVLIFTGLVFWAIRQNRSAISELNANKANIVALQKTNCGLRGFLLTAEKARHAAALHEKGKRRAEDQTAARSYNKLARVFTKDGCRGSVFNP